MRVPARQCKNDRRSLFAASSLAVCSLAMAETDPPRPKETLETVVVSAQKRDERLQDVPISISVLGGKELDSSTGQGVMEALRTVPGVGMFQGFQTGGPQISIRGVTALNNFGGGSNPIAYYLDTVPFSFVKSAITPDAGGYDLERVEVLRGPQSTLYGASAQNGVVRVLTKDADLDSFSLKARTLGSYTEDGGSNYRGDAALNIPIIEGKLAARAVGGYQDLSGWIDRPNDKDANDAQIRNFRLKVNAAPTDELSIGLSGWLSRADYGAPPAGTDDRTHRSLTSEAIEDNFDIYALKIGYQFGSFALSSNSSYIDYTLNSELDVNLAASGALLLTTNLANRLFAQEVYLNSTNEGAWRWSIGAMYRDAEDKSYQLRHNAAGVPVGGYVQPAVVSQLSESRAVFGELTRLFADGKLELTGGLRYFEDDVGLREHARFTSTTATLVNSDAKFDATSPRAVLTWHISDQTTTYLSYAEGFRSGADQNPTIVELAPYIPETKPDNLINYEMGVKGSILDGRLAYDTSVYYMDWQDVQQIISVAYQTASLSALINGVSASGLGYDLSVTAEPADGFNVGLSVSVNDLTQDEDVSTTVSPTQSYVLNKKGQRLPLSPKYTASGRAGYEFAFGNSGYRAEFSTSANYVSERTIYYLVSGQQVALSGDQLTLIDAQFAVTSPYGWTVTLFGDNLGDEDGTASRHPSWPEWTSRPRPRTIGLQFDYRL